MFIKVILLLVHLGDFEMKSTLKMLVVHYTGLKIWTNTCFSISKLMVWMRIFIESRYSACGMNYAKKCAR